MTNLEISKLTAEQKEVLGYSIVWIDWSVGKATIDEGFKSNATKRRMIDAWAGKIGEQPVNFVEVEEKDWMEVLCFNQKVLRPFKEPKGANFPTSYFV